jgi:hypothetical protein
MIRDQEIRNKLRNALQIDHFQVRTNKNFLFGDTIHSGTRRLTCQNQGLTKSDLKHAEKKGWIKKSTIGPKNYHETVYLSLQSQEKRLRWLEPLRTIGIKVRRFCRNLFSRRTRLPGAYERS